MAMQPFDDHPGFFYYSPMNVVDSQTSLAGYQDISSQSGSNKPSNPPARTPSFQSTAAFWNNMGKKQANHPPPIHEGVSPPRNGYVINTKPRLNGPEVSLAPQPVKMLNKGAPSLVYGVSQDKKKFGNGIALNRTASFTVEVNGRPVAPNPRARHSGSEQQFRQPALHSSQQLYSTRPVIQASHHHITSSQPVLSTPQRTAPQPPAHVQGNPVKHSSSFLRPSAVKNNQRGGTPPRQNVNMPNGHHQPHRGQPQPRPLSANLDRNVAGHVQNRPMSPQGNKNRRDVAAHVPVQPIPSTTHPVPKSNNMVSYYTPRQRRV